MMRNRCLSLLFILTLGIILSSPRAYAQFAKVDGPNCINNALVEAHILPFHRYSSLSEMNIIINSNLCQKVALDDTQSHLIGLIYSEAPSAQKDIISHAFIRLNADLAQEKHGWSRSEPYQFTTILEILNEYEVTQPQKSVAYYRCQTWSEFLEKNKISANTKNLLAQLYLIERKLNLVLELESSSTDDEIHEIDKMIVGFSKNVLKNSLHEDFFIKKVIATRIVSISNQLEIIGHNTLHAKTYQWEFQTQNVEGVFEALSN